MTNIPEEKSSLSTEEKRKVLTQLLQQKILNDREVVISPEHFNIEMFPEYINLQERLKMFSQYGQENPYFAVHDGINSSTTVINGRELINYSSYNYLGMSGDSFVSKAAQKAIDCYGTSVSASRIISGEISLHQELEKELSGLIGVEDCILYVGGYATNLATIGHLFGEGDLILHDSLIHDSAYQGCLLSGATRIAFPHNSWTALNKILQTKRGDYKRVLIVIEGAYSMDGDIPDLPNFIQLKNQYKTFLMVDEAHSIGVLGKHGGGIGELFDIDRSEIDLWMGTLSKSFASCGGYIAGSKAMIEYLKYTSPGFVYSVGMSPANTGAALAAIRLLKSEPQRVQVLHERARLFLKLARNYSLNTGMSDGTAVVPIIIGNSIDCVQVSQKLLQRGINVLPMVYPATPENSARLRFFISYTHTEEQIYLTVKAVAEELSKLQTK